MLFIFVSLLYLFSLSLCLFSLFSLYYLSLSYLSLLSVSLLSVSLLSLFSLSLSLSSLSLSLLCRGGSTQTGLALKYVLRKGFPSSGNSTIPRILILLSDGRSQGAVQLAATELKQTGVTLFAVGLRHPR